jgi:hypothetical protein
LFVIITVSPTLAKNPAPGEVTPIEKDGIVFEVAQLRKTGGLTWPRQVNVVKYGMGLDKDVQGYLATKLEFDDRDTLVTNEASHRYELNPDTPEVTPNKRVPDNRFEHAGVDPANSRTQSAPLTPGADSRR